METKHTPGPWQAAADCGSSGHWAAYTAGGRKLALVFDPADARLIAAAPDMLAALEAAEGALASFVDGNPEPNLRAVDAIADFARAAIAEARGE